MEPVLELRALSKHYAAHRAVNNISLSVGAGEFFSLVGPSGCGKSTTLRLIGGFEESSSGEVLLGNKSVAQLPPYRRDVSTVFQNYALFPHLSVAKNISFGLERRRGVDSAAIRDRVHSLLTLVKLEGKERRLPQQLSGGERQRVALARSLVLEPMLLLLDEPLSALDPQLRKEMRTELKSIQRRTGIAFLFVTHDQEEALSLSDRMAVMHNGCIEQIGTPRELYTRPRSRFVAEFLGPVNWIDRSAVRPEAVRVSRDRPRLDAKSTAGVVEETTYFGNCVHLHARLPDGRRCTAELRRECAFRKGESIHLWWRAEDELSI